eukprot:5686666-Pyramimonas_sp.AAC.1
MDMCPHPSCDWFSLGAAQAGRERGADVQVAARVLEEELRAGREGARGAARGVVLALAARASAVQSGARAHLHRGGEIGSSVDWQQGGGRGGNSHLDLWGE